MEQTRRCPIHRVDFLRLLRHKNVELNTSSIMNGCAPDFIPIKPSPNIAKYLESLRVASTGSNRIGGPHSDALVGGLVIM